MTFLDALIAAKLAGGSGGSITVDDTLSATSENPVQNKTLYTLFTSLGNYFTPWPTKTTVSGTTPTITPANNTIYECGELTSLTVTDPPATGTYVIKFDSGSAATTTTFPASIHGLEDFAAEANTHYEISVEDGYAVVMGWPISGGGGA